MSELVNNLQSIYNIKLQIKDVLGTDSDLFEDYPDLIEAAIGEGGGSGSSADPWYDFTDTYEMIVNEETSADFVRSNICENFEYTEENDEYTISWDDIREIENEELDENDEPIIEEKKIHVVLTGDPHEIYAEGSNIASALEDYENLYYSISPILENATLTASEDPSEDGYDYLLEGDLYAWNLIDNCAEVTDVTENGFYPSGGALGINIDVDIQRQNNYHIFDLRSQSVPLTGNTENIDVTEIQNYNQIIHHTGFEVNYIDPSTMEETTNSYYNYELYDSTGVEHISDIVPVGVFSDNVSYIQAFEYTGQNNAYVYYISTYNNYYTEEIDPDTGDPISNWEHSNVSNWSGPTGKHMFELEPDDVIYITSYETTVGQSLNLATIVYRNGEAIYNNYYDNAMWPYEGE